MWFKFTTPGGSTSLTVNTFGSSYDTILSVFTGTCPTPLTQAACNDDSSGTVQSSVSFTDSVGNTDYYFMVSSYSPGGGTLYLKITTP